MVPGGAHLCEVYGRPVWLAVTVDEHRSDPLIEVRRATHHAGHDAVLHLEAARQRQPFAFPERP